MDYIELRIELTEQIVRDLLWRALAPESIVMLSELTDAIERQQEQLGRSFEGYQLTNISVTTKSNVMYAELGYTANIGAGGD